MEGFDLGAYLDVERGAVEAAQRRLVDDLLGNISDVIAEPIRYALEAGGKRLRPILCVTAYRAAAPPASAAGGAPQGIYEIACAIEFIHTYSLVHDDLPCMDDDDLRRGRPTTHKVFGESRAIRAGAALIPLACQALSRGARGLGLTTAERAALVHELCGAAGGGGMVGGQWLDLEAEGRSVTVVELEAIHRLKTGALLAASLRLGGLAARADTVTLTALGDYGRAVGLAFQIADDLLDLTGNTALLGKTAGRDVDLSKATYPALLGLEGARARANQEVGEAITALRRAGIESPELEALARYAIERDR